jgi:hypothetical protein
MSLIDEEIFVERNRCGGGDPPGPSAASVLMWTFDPNVGILCLALCFR